MNAGIRKRAYPGNQQSIAKRAFKPPRKVARASVKQMVAAAIRQVAEKKFFDALLSTQTPATTAQLTNINTIGGGNTDQTRVGNKINVVSAGYHFTAQLDGDESQGNQMRLILYIDHQSNGSTPGATDILQTNTFDSYQNLDNVDRFVILDDRIVDIPAYAGIATAPVPQPISSNCYKQLKNCQVSYPSDSAVVPGTNGIGLLQIARNTGATYNVQFRVKFTDT